MSTATAPSTDWKERVAPDEEERFKGYAAQFTEFQRRKSQRLGAGRALHRVQHVGLRAQLEVLPALPPHAAQGLFAAPGRYEAWVRLSNGSADRQPDRRPDVRGFSIKVLGVSGEGVFGGPAPSQDFLLINHPRFAAPSAEAFVGIATAAAKGPLALLGHMFSRHGLGAFAQLRRLAGTLGKPFFGFAAEPMYSAAPIACGPYAARVRLVPAQERPAQRPADLAADMRARAQQGELRYDLQLQFFTDEKITPIEDASVDWPEAQAPYLTVAKLTIPRQDTQGAEAEALGRQIEAAIFDPWSALAAHRPLGEIMRARKVVYFDSQKERGAR